VRDSVKEYNGRHVLIFFVTELEHFFCLIPALFAVSRKALFKEIFNFKKLIYGSSLCL
jgi:hypothetical protein